MARARANRPFGLTVIAALTIFHGVLAFALVYSGAEWWITIGPDGVVRMAVTGLDALINVGTVLQIVYWRALEGSRPYQIMAFAFAYGMVNFAIAYGFLKGKRWTWRVAVISLMILLGASLVSTYWAVSVLYNFQLRIRPMSAPPHTTQRKLRAHSRCALIGVLVARLRLSPLL